MSAIEAPEKRRGLAALPSTLPALERRAVIPAGFAAASGIAGIKASGRPDLTIVATVADPSGVRPAAAAAAVFTPNAFAAAPVRLSRAHLGATEPAGRGRYGWATGIISTSGCANAATGAAGDVDQAAVAGFLADALDVPIERTLLLSTGVIGTRLPLDKVERGVASVAPGLKATDAALAGAAEALRTTDTRTKVASVSFALPDPDGLAVRSVRVTGIAKGVGMIHPRMATMLSIVLTDASVDPATLSGLLGPAAARTWDQLTVDGDTSTNDTVFLLASGAAGAATVVAGTREAAELGAAIEAVARDLARQQAADGEGASTLVTCQVSGGVDDAEARAVARAVVGSSLVKAAVHGRDPNWGRIAGAAGNAVLADEAVLAAAGVPPAAAKDRAGTAATVEPDRLRIAIGGHLVFDGSAGGPTAFDKAAVRTSMDTPELLIRLDLGLGSGVGEAFGCDLTEEYVRENSEYTT
jgi:glutamate N-acetyltransferase/amino-acid N-acetyltransferase